MQVNGRVPFSRDWYTLSSTNASLEDLGAAGLEGYFVPGVDGSDNYTYRAVDYGTGQPAKLLPCTALSRMHCSLLCIEQQKAQCSGLYQAGLLHDLDMVLALAQH